ncbi:MAG: PPC domain-containing protein [Deltaproteobacteria bacterium]|nr:PPC domain-containing protein [Deltaproteobacteria bacterium]
MRRLASTIVLALAVMSCGDNFNVPPDAKLPQCSDGIDNDGDGDIDYPRDLGCDDSNDDSEDSPAKPQCSDGRDNDGDGKTDFPNDPGCISALADDESDDCPSGPGCPQCGNGIDDDGNGFIDFPADPGCESAADNEEFQHNPDACGMGLLVKELPANLTDTGMFDGSSISQIMTACGGGGGSSGVAYELHLTTPKFIVATTTGPSDTVIDLRRANCQAPESHITCNDDISRDNHNSRIQQSLPAGYYYLIVQGHDSSVLGPYTITVELFGAEGTSCQQSSECGPTLVCRVPLGGTDKQCLPHVCADNVDEDGDGHVGYPTDPGCDSPEDDDESDDCPNGPNCPECGNGIDDDGDGLIDYPNDPACTAASSRSEACNGEEDPIVRIVGAQTLSTLVGAHDNHNPSCGGELGPDRIFTISLPKMRSLTVDTIGSSFDTVLSIMTAACSEPSLRCDDDSGGSGNTSKITLTNLAAGGYTIAVDAYSNNTPLGAFRVNVTGVIEIGGACDPTATLGGALACPSTSTCAGPAGQQVCQAPACSDGIDNDGDGKIDFPNDPGCANVDGPSEVDDCPNGPNCPQCADGIDNDGDGQIDYPNDTSCTSASGNSEACTEQDPVVNITTGTTLGTLVGAHDDHPASCGSSGGVDKLFTLRLPQMARLTLDTENSVVDTVLSFMTSSCQEPAIECDDDDGVSPGASLIERTNVAAGDYTIAVDAYSATTTLGTFQLHVSGTIANGGSCEGPLAASGAIRCATTAACAGPAGMRVCVPAACSDGIDNDGDGKIDYPNDPGCDLPGDTSEEDTCPGAGCPQCGDGVDNDGDGNIDFSLDKSCWAASAPNEAFCNAENDRALFIFQPVTTFSTATATNDFPTQTCQSNTSGRDMVAAITLPVPVTALRIDTNQASFDTVLSVRDQSCGTQLACDDDGGDGTRSLVTLNNVAANTTLAILVDGYNGQSGTVVLRVTGTVANGTACTHPLFTSGLLACTGAATCSPATGTCQ